MKIFMREFGSHHLPPLSPHTSTLHLFFIEQWPPLPIHFYLTSKVIIALDISRLFLPLLPFFFACRTYPTLPSIRPYRYPSPRHLTGVVACWFSFM